MKMGIDKQDLPAKIRAARVLASKTQQDMATELSVARQTYLDLEAGRTIPRVDVLEKIAKATDFPIVWFLEQSVPDVDYTDIKENKEVIDLLMTISKLPCEHRTEMVRTSKRIANLLLLNLPNEPMRCVD
ncbi:helix-turn-helix domain-containing protein [Thaumasiovibrio subtropicus]|uniref:helix-turn-helix domain-containing protein n=1 Tax=Thaumasiovibrio subtropicus TaxID=1891207 RepID=UPI000B357A29|nr:helix-turn-helix transcriptional regulator [Thaumasiovibrio subtropicus]